MEQEFPCVPLFFLNKLTCNFPELQKLQIMFQNLQKSTLLPFYVLQVSVFFCNFALPFFTDSMEKAVIMIKIGARL